MPPTALPMPPASVADTDAAVCTLRNLTNVNVITVGNGEAVDVGGMVRDTLSLFLVVVFMF